VFFCVRGKCFHYAEALRKWLQPAPLLGFAVSTFVESGNHFPLSKLNVESGTFHSGK